MTAEDAFLADVLPRFIEAETALHNGDIGPRVEMWSQRDPVTLFGAAFSATGWDEIHPIFELLASRFSRCESYECEVIAAGVSGDLGYVVALEHTTASVAGNPPEPYSLRVTSIYRREDDTWKIVHRHGDPVPDSAGAQNQLRRMTR